MPSVRDEADGFYDGCVRPTVEEFERDRMDRRRGILAALMVNSFADHIFETRHAARFPEHEREDEKRRFVARHFDASEEFRIVRQVANAAKHAVVRGRRKGRPQPVIKMAGDIRFEGYTEPGYVEEGYWEEGVFVPVGDGREAPLLPLIHGAVRYLRGLP